MRTDFNPFSKQFDAISTKDLALLTTITEGWYVEYKSEVSNAGAIAKSFSSFANTYGGWVFYGVSEKSKDDPIAGTFKGIPNEDADGCLQRIRQALANHLQPAPYYQVRALFGPEPNIGLEEGRCIIIAFIPWGPEAPYIHKDGRIYRRVGDGSEPRPENDRFILDQLWQRSNQIKDKHLKWISTEPELSQGEESSSYIRIFLIPDFWEIHIPETPPSLSDIQKLMSSKEGDYVISFENIYRTSGGFICRHLANNNPENQTLTWKISNNFKSEIIVPLSKYKADISEIEAMYLNGYQNAKDFIELCKKQGYSNPCVIDFNILFHVLLCLMQKFIELSKLFDSKQENFVAKIEISGVWRTIPFLDIDKFILQYKKYGIPFCLKNKKLIGEGKERNSYIDLPIKIEPEDKSYKTVMAYILFARVALAMGIPLPIGTEIESDELTSTVIDIVNAGNRAIEKYNGAKSTQ